MDITNDIISFIFTEKQLSLPGLGMLRLSKSSAYRSPARTKIYGPKFNIELQDSEYDKAINEKFYQYVANKHKKSVRKVEDEVNKFSIGILNDLANFNSAQIENLGSFKRVNDKIQFEFSPLFNDLLKESYPDFPLLSIDRKQNLSKDISTQDVVTPTPPVSPRKAGTNGKPGWIFPLIVLTLLSLGFVCLMYCLSGVFPDNKVERNSNIEKPAVITPDSQGKKTTEKPNKVLDTASQIIGSNVTNQNHSENSSSTDSDINQKDLDNLDKISLEELIDLGSDLKSNFNKSCIIIVGSFKRKSNSIRMKNRLLKDNFVPYVEKYGKFYRTGVVFDCDKKPLFKFLEELRNSIDKESWVLKYK